jgi:ferredoxin
MSETKSNDSAPKIASSCRVRLEGPEDTKEITARSNEHIWDAALAQGILLPAICHQGFCLTCAGRLLAPGEFDSSDCEQYFPEDREAGYILLCTSKARSDLRIRTHAADDMRRHRVAHRLPSPYS